MGGRYLITGTELALLYHVSEQQRIEMLKKIEDERWLYESDLPIDEDTRWVRMRINKA